MEKDAEGKLTKTRALIVCENSLARAARNFDLGSYMYIGRGEEMAGGRNRASILADAMEAVIGALYLDGGYEITRNFVLRTFSDIVDEAVAGKLFSDYKSEIQEKLQKNGKNISITYTTDREEGPAHNKTFFVHLSYDGKILGEGSGKSKKEAEQNAARTALCKLNRSETDVF